jgi:hypothetical protein
MRWWHKWIGIAIGLVLVLWVVSGIAMMAPLSPAVWGADIPEPPLDLAGVTITPNQAAAIAGQHRSDTDSPAALRTIVLRPLLGAAVYLVTHADAAPVLVDAGSGEVIAITADRAREIASRAVAGRTPISADRITKAPIGYGGRLPAYRMVFDDPAGTIAIVAEATGELSRTGRWDRRKMLLGHYVHVFVPLKALPGGDRTRIAALVGTGIVALLSIFSGYWLSLPGRVRRARRM